MVKIAKKIPIAIITPPNTPVLALASFFDNCFQPINLLKYSPAFPKPNFSSTVKIINNIPAIIKTTDTYIPNAIFGISTPKA